MRFLKKASWVRIGATITSLVGVLLVVTTKWDGEYYLIASVFSVQVAAELFTRGK